MSILSRKALDSYGQQADFRNWNQAFGNVTQLGGMLGGFAHDIQSRRLREQEQAMRERQMKNQEDQISFMQQRYLEPRNEAFDALHGGAAQMAPGYMPTTKPGVDANPAATARYRAETAGGQVGPKDFWKRTPQPVAGQAPVGFADEIAGAPPGVGLRPGFNPNNPEDRRALQIATAARNAVAAQDMPAHLALLKKYPQIQAQIEQATAGMDPAVKEQVLKMYSAKLIQQAEAQKQANKVEVMREGAKMTADRTFGLQANADRNAQRAALQEAATAAMEEATRNNDIMGMSDAREQLRRIPEDMAAGLRPRKRTAASNRPPPPTLSQKDASASIRGMLKKINDEQFGGVLPEQAEALWKATEERDGKSYEPEEIIKMYGLQRM